MNDPATIAALSKAFEPASMEGMAKRYHDLLPEIRRLERERENLGVILAEHCQRTGEVIVVEGQPNLRWQVKSYDGRGNQVYGLKFDDERCPRCRAKTELQTDVCAPCAKELRREGKR